MKHEYLRDVIAAIATPPGRGGIGVVRVSGHELEPFFAGLLHRTPEPRYAHYGDFYDRLGAIIDTGVALHFPAPHSFTGEHVLEVQGHGGPAVMGLLLERCLDIGARLAEPGEFTKRAFLNGKIDLAQAESVADLIEATTAAAARAATRSLRGEFSQRIRTLVDALIHLRMLTEATLDFPDEEIDLLRETDARGELARVRHDLAALVARARQGQLLREGVRVALIGRPNVGKSSLLNQLAGDDVAIVTPIPGTTRDAIRQEIEVQGVPLHVIDTAGLREAADEVERIGIARTWRVASEADVAVLIVEAARGVDIEEQIILGRLPTALRVIVVHNKIDLSGAEAGRFLRDGREHVYLSAKTGEGVDLFGTALLDTVGGQGESNEAFTARERHVRALLQARDHLAKAAEHVDARTTAIELFAEELRLAQQALTAITGEFSADDLLGEIFSRFCIGK